MWTLFNLVDDSIVHFKAVTCFFRSIEKMPLNLYNKLVSTSVMGGNTICLPRCGCFQLYLLNRFVAINYMYFGCH